MPLKPASRSLAPLFLDLLVTALAIGLVLPTVMNEMQPGVFKARFISVLWTMSAARPAVMEEYAMRGAWRGADTSEGPRRPIEGFPGRYHVEIADGNIMASGSLRGRTFSGGMRPAVSDPASHWSVLWLCGARTPPPGWTASPGSLEFPLPGDLVLSMCRKARA